MLNFLLLTTFLLLVLMFGTSEQQIVFGTNSYTEFHYGDVNILISIPHEGKLLPSSIKNRTADASNNLVSDFNTRKLGLAIRDELKVLLKKTPFAVLSNLHRIKMDANRDSVECCAVQTEMSTVAYQDYHNFIQQKFEQEFMQHGSTYYQGLVIDIHGQSHADNWTEIGYLQTTSQLNANNIRAKDSSIRLLAATCSYTFEELLRGHQASFGGILQNKFNLKVVPSPNYPSPGSGGYYNGGFITKTYGSSSCRASRLNAIQIEHPYYLRTEANVLQTAKIIASAIYDYYKMHNIDQQCVNTNTECANEMSDLIMKCQLVGTTKTASKSKITKPSVFEMIKEFMKNIFFFD